MERCLPLMVALLDQRRHSTLNQVVRSGLGVRSDDVCVRFPYFPDYYSIREKSRCVLQLHFSSYQILSSLNFYSHSKADRK